MEGEARVEGEIGDGRRQWRQQIGEWESEREYEGWSGSLEIGFKMCEENKRKKKNEGFTTRPTQKKSVLWLRVLNAA